jgi:gluconolactonase
MPGKQELAFQGIYRIFPNGNSLELLVNEIYRPNGMAFSPDETQAGLQADREGVFRRVFFRRVLGGLSDD